MALLGLAIGLGFLLYAPSLRPVADSLFLFAGFHIVGAIVLLASAYAFGLRRVIAMFRQPAAPRRGPLCLQAGDRNG